MVSSRRNDVPRHRPVGLALAGVLTVVVTVLTASPAFAAGNVFDIGATLGFGSGVVFGGPVGLAVVVLGVSGMVAGLIRRRRLAVASARTGIADQPR